MSDRPQDVADSTRDNTPVVSRMPSNHDGHQPQSRRASPTSAPNPLSRPNTVYHASQSGRPFELPPLPGTSGAGSKGNPTTRLAGVSSILNPTLPVDDFAKESRPHPAPAADHNAGNASPFQRRERHSPVTAFGNPPSRSQATNMAEVETRRILTPKSPSATLHRALSLGQMRSETRDAPFQQPPFPPSPHPRSYQSDMIRPSSLAQLPISAESEVNEKVNAGPSRILGAIPNSGSPSASYAAYHQNMDTSPGSKPSHLPPAFHPSSRAAPLTPVTSSLDMTRSYGAEGADPRQRAVGIPISSSGGQNVYQMMTLETTSGRVQLPVDVQAASRVADEKRRRNAGASARFRQRRKEKEKEASSTISRLEQRVKDLGEEVDFYKRERDYLASVVVQMPGGERHLTRAPSPRRRRTPSTGASSSASAYHGSHDYQSRSADEGRNVRRRASSLSLGAHHTAPTIPMSGHGHSTSYTPIYAPTYGYGLRPMSPSAEAQYFHSMPQSGGLRAQPPPHHPGHVPRPLLATSPSMQNTTQNPTVWGPHSGERLPPISGPRDQPPPGSSISRPG